MHNPTILIPDRLRPPADIEYKVLGEGARILTPGASQSSEIQDEVWESADAILAWHEIQFTHDVLTKLKQCRIIVRVGVGFDNVDLEAAGKLGIPVCNVPDYGTNEVADHTLAMILGLARGVYAYSEQVRTSNDNWTWGVAGKLHRLSGATLGIIGMGRIGTAVALRAKAFGMNVVFYDPYIPDGQDKALGVTRVGELYELLQPADIVTIHTPLTDETRNMANGVFFSGMKPGAIFINTARGPIVNLNDLAEALKSERLRGAGLDVLPDEPPDPEHPLIRDWRAREEWIAYRLLITPHSAFFSEESYEEMRYKAAVEAKRVLEGEPPRNCVNKEELKLYSATV